MKSVRVHLFISGKVQGVFFRSMTESRATDLGLKGWVKNLEDGRVEAVFEGPEDKVEEIVDWCRMGPIGSVVDSVDVTEEEVTDEDEGFRMVL